MEKATRTLIERATHAARRTLEREFGQQLEGEYDILPDGRILPEPGAHLDERGQLRRAKLVEAVGHRRAAGLAPQEAVAATTREAAFTTLNRFVALKMLEARGMVQECISKGENSAGFREFGGLAPGLATTADKGYRLYLESVFDEIGREVRVLFDRRDVVGTLWPRRQALGELLDLLNDPALAEVWGADETIGWVYQYFNGEDERRKMRDESQAPRNSRELAVRNQFFTPRYVVEFLTDNTLGRTWYEMRAGQTRLRDECRYLIRRFDEVFLGAPEGWPADDSLIAQDRAFLADEAATMAPFALPGGAWHAEPGIMPYHVGDDGLMRLIAFAHHARPFDWGNDPRAEGWERALAALATSDTDPFLAAPTQYLWDCLLTISRADRFDEGLVARHAPALARIANEIRRRLLGARRTDATQEESLRAPVLIRHRAKKDPRDLKILDPACGSGHFLLYCFDLLTTIYEEGWEEEYHPESETTGATLRADYPTLDALRAALPGLILHHNLHGIDIDPRAAQIAELALWMRAQRAYNDLGLARGGRAPIRKTNIVVAEPMPGDKEMLSTYLRGVDERLRPLALTIWEKMKLAGEAGSLLRIEREVVDVIAQGRRKETSEMEAQTRTAKWGGAVAIQTALPKQNDVFWDEAEEALLVALRDFAAHATSGGAMSRRLFAENAAHGFAFVDLCRKKFDVVLMNPPFGAATIVSRRYVELSYPRTRNDIYATFVERGLSLLHSRGQLGAITSRTGFFLLSFQKWREEIMLKEAYPVAVADLGHGVLDSAMVETAAYCLEKVA